MASHDKIAMPSWVFNFGYSIAGAVISILFTFGVAAARGDEKVLAFDRRMTAIEEKLVSYSTHAARLAVAESRQDETVRRLAGIEANLDKLVIALMQPQARTQPRR